MAQWVQHISKQGEKWEVLQRHIIPVTESGCWLWESSENPQGYGQLTFKKQHYSAHCFSYELYRGAIPEGMTLDHLCRVRCCVNPDHLEVVTNKVNILRGIGVTARNSRKTHCKHGHEFTPENTYIYKYRATGGRACLICRRRVRRETAK